MATELSIDKELDECAYQINLVGKEIAVRLPVLGMWCAQARDLLSQRRDGSFASWAEKNVKVSLGYCYGAIRVWEKFGDCNGCKIDVRAMLLLSSPSVPEEARQQAIEESKSQPVTAKRAKEIVDECRMDAAGPPDTGASEADDASELEPEDRAAVAVEDLPEPTPAPRQAKASGPVEPNQIGGAIRQVTGELEFAIENLADFQVAAVFEGVSAWMAAERERRKIRP